MKDSEQKEMQINEEIRLLPQWEGTYQELIELPVPGLSETVKKFEKEHSDLIQKLQKTQEQIENHKMIIEGNEERIRELDSLAEIPSEEKLLPSVRIGILVGKSFVLKLEHGDWDFDQLATYTNGERLKLFMKISYVMQTI